MHTSQTQNTNFTYFITEKGDVLVINFAGSMSKMGEATFERCATELAQKKFKYVVICLGEISTIDYVGIAFFVRLQKTLRDHPSKLRICHIRPRDRELLEERGAIRSQEICGTLIDALKSFSLLPL